MLQLISNSLWLIFVVIVNLFISLITSVAYMFLFVLIYILCRSILILKERLTKLRPNPNYAIMITGATSGLGLALAKFYHSLGFTIIGGYFNKTEQGFEELTKLNNELGRLYLIPMDVTSVDSIKSSRKDVEAILAKCSQLKLYCIVNNAGIAPSLVPIHMESRRTIKGLIDTNLIGPMMTVREFMPLLIESKGRIINVSSGLAYLPNEQIALYGCSKAALLYLTRCMMRETEYFGVKSIIILPGNLIKNTNINRGLLLSKKRTWDEFEEDEQFLYGRHFKVLEDQAIEETDNLEKLIQGDTSVKPFQLVQCLEPPKATDAETKEQLKSNQSGCLQQIRQFIVGRIDICAGASDSLKLEETSVMDAFDDAIRSLNPTQILFAGNRWYQFFTGPFYRWVPDALLDIVRYSASVDIDPSVEDFINNRTKARSI